MGAASTVTGPYSLPHECPPIAALTCRLACPGRVAHLVANVSVQKVQSSLGFLGEPGTGDAEGHSGSPPARNQRGVRAAGSTSLPINDSSVRKYLTSDGVRSNSGSDRAGEPRGY